MVVIVIYDTTLRDGAQTPHLNLSLEGKLRITGLLHELGIPYIEGGFAGSNPRDEAYFREVMKMKKDGRLPKTKIAAFGMTAKTKDVENDIYIRALIDTNVDVFTIVGKTHRDQVVNVLKMLPQDYLEIIRKSVDYLKSTGKEVFFDAEHFFDGYKYDKDYALKVLEAAKNADVLVLCDTNGSAWPEEVYEIVSEVKNEFSNQMGIHCHNDRGLAAANSLAAVKAGAGHVQVTVNGMGERAGNADLSTMIMNLNLSGYNAIPSSDLKRLTSVATEVGRSTGRRVPYNMPFVGPRAFYHTGGMHTDAMIKMPGSYEHMNPLLIGNKRYFVISEQSGKAVVKWWAEKFGFEIPDKKLPVIIEEINRLQNFGEAQIYLLMRKNLENTGLPFEIIDGKVVDGFNSYPEATMSIRVNCIEYNETSEGDGPVNALDLALRKALSKAYPKVSGVLLVDYNVELPAEEKGTESRVDVSIILRYDDEEFESRATDTDIVKASLKALVDAYLYYLLRNKI